VWAGLGPAAAMTPDWMTPPVCGLGWAARDTPSRVLQPHLAALALRRLHQEGRKLLSCSGSSASALFWSLGLTRTRVVVAGLRCRPASHVQARDWRNWPDTWLAAKRGLLEIVLLQPNFAVRGRECSGYPPPGPPIMQSSTRNTFRDAVICGTRIPAETLPVLPK
jgi:hypothetical protein